MMFRFGGKRYSGNAERARNSKGSASIQRPVTPKRKRSFYDSLRFAIRWALTRAGLLALIGVIIYWGLMVDPRPKVNVAGKDMYRPDSEYAKVVNSSINRLRDSTKFTFDSNRINANIKSTFPEVESSTVELPFIGRQPVVRVNISAPTLQVINSRGESYIISATGKVVGPAKELSQIKNLLVLKDQSGLPISVGQQILGENQVDFIKVISGQSSKASVRISFMALTSTPQEVDMYLNGKDYFVKFLMSGDPLGQVGTMLATLKYLKSHHITPTQYIDVRVSGKVFYK